jgi:hypothetical protein
MTEYSRSEDFISMKLEIELIKKDIYFINTLIERLDLFMTKIQDQQDIILEKTNIIIESKAKLTADDLSDLSLALDKTKTILNDKIFILEKSILEEVSDVKSDLMSHVANDNSLVRKYNRIIYVSGAILAIVVWGFNNLDFVKFLIK